MTKNQFLEELGNGLKASLVNKNLKHLEETINTFKK